MTLWQAVTRAVNAEDWETKQRDKKLDALFDKADEVINEITIDLKRPKKKTNGRSARCSK